jgi:hypothetical protein
MDDFGGRTPTYDQEEEDVDRRNARKKLFSIYHTGLCSENNTSDKLPYR